LILISATLALVVTLGCAARETYMVPPRIDLTRHEVIGVIEINSSSKGELGPLATRRFTDEARRDQDLVRIVAIGTEADALASVGSGRLDRDTLKAIGHKHGVQTILMGELTVSDIRPDIRIASTLDAGSLTGKVDATLAVQLIEASSGASIWSTSARATHGVGHISVFGGGDFVFDAEDPERAYGGLVDMLVSQATRDFRVTWARR
jgi:hypothetical protein